MANNNGFRNIIGHAGTPVQQSMTVDPSMYAGRRMDGIFFGIVLSVFQSDDANNESAIRTSSQHGYLHQCSILITNDGFGSNMILSKAYILPDQISGVDDYYEHLPKGCTRSFTDQPFNANLVGLDPTQLDGERCLVAFIGGNIDQPFILKWYPHPQNVFDSQTTGQGFPDREGIPQALNQTGRRFTRTNGVEQVITNRGDVFINTNFTNSTIAPSKVSTKGRYGRELNAQEGGSIKVNVKPSQYFILDFNEYEDGVGITGYNDQLPQTNPRPTGFGTAISTTNTNVNINRDRVIITTPQEFSVMSSGTSTLTSSENSNVNVGGDYIIDVVGDVIESVQGSKDSATAATDTISAGDAVLIRAGIGSGSGGTVEVTSTGSTIIACGAASSGADDPFAGAFVVRSGGNVEIFAGNEGDADFVADVTHDLLIDVGNEMRMTMVGDTTIETEHVLNLTGAEVNIGDVEDLGPQFAILLKAFASDPLFISTMSTVNALPPIATTPVQVAAAVNALVPAFKALVSALENTCTDVTRAN